MKPFLLFFILYISMHSYAQKSTLFESIEYTNAYEKGTRSRTGKPGETYWQNRSDYEIKARFYPDSSLIKGTLKVTYFNESPDSLNSLVLKLMQNVYKKGANRQMAIDIENIHDGIKIENVSFNGSVLDENSIAISGTVMRISLPNLIKSKTNCTLEMDFVTPIPKTSGFRSGTIDSTSFFIAYWFPQVAVYDDIFGWDTDEYVGVAENYNEFSNYHVELTLPSQYHIWATGKHTNKDDIYPAGIIDRIEQSKSSKKPVLILSEEDFKTADGKVNIWKFTAENVPDFAWGASDHYVWEGASANNPDSLHAVWVQTAYPLGAKHFNWVLSVSQKSVELFSNHFPGIPYPYFKHITFRGTDGGGMEFPMLANNNVAMDSTSTIMVTAHELAHNYFPFMMGINERKYGWWDETMTTLMESFINDYAYPRYKVRGFFNRKMSFNIISPDHDILPIITETSNIMKVMPSIINYYVKGPAAMDILMNLIGTDKFYAYTWEFMKIWSWKHPTPYDFFNFINEKEGKNLNWFWHSWFFSYGYPDLAIADAHQNESYLKIKVINAGGLPVPFKLTIDYADGRNADEEYNVDIWAKDTGSADIRIPVSGTVDKVTLDGTFSYDVRPKNNEYYLK